MPIRVLICDDQTLVRAGFRKLLEATGDVLVIGEAADGLEAVERARDTLPDVILMDIRMPRLDGITAMQKVVEVCGPSVRILVLTTFNDDKYVFESLRSGASGFMLKDAPPEELLTAIRVIAQGDALLDPAVTRGRRLRTRSPPVTSAQSAGASDRPRGRHATAPRLRPVERRNRRSARHQRGNRQDARRARPHETSRAGSRSSCGAGLRERPGRELENADGIAASRRL
jgi:DNA-binding NarL/FixJ family response regulator